MEPYCPVSAICDVSGQNASYSSSVKVDKIVALEFSQLMFLLVSLSHLFDVLDKTQKDNFQTVTLR